MGNLHGTRWGKDARWRAGVAIWAPPIGVIVLLVLSCGDGTIEPAPPPVPVATTVTVSPASASMTALGETVRLSAEVRDQNGQVMTGAAVAWASSDASVAAVDASGLVTAAGNGTATITASAGTASGTAAVTVMQEVSTVTISSAADTLVAGDTLRVSAGAADANDNAIEGVDFAWASSDTLVAVVDQAGLVVGVGAGQAEVTATAAGVTGRAEFTVVAPAPTTVAVSPDTVALTALGRTVQLSAEVRDQTGRVMEDIQVSWSSVDTTVAAVDAAGVVTAVSRGTAKITATAGEASGEAVVTVMQSAGSVVVLPAVDTVALGDTLRLVTQAFDENGHVIEDTDFGWSSSDRSVATVDGSGLVMGVAEGAATITATAGDARGTAEITVESPDRAALVALYNATDGTNWVHNDKWLTDAPLAEWHGVRVSATGRVQVLQLMDNNLVGPIPIELSSLSRLTILRLSHNGLEGAIPPELGNLVSLTWLDLANNNLIYPIPPELGNLVNLTRLCALLELHDRPDPARTGQPREPDQP